MRSTFVIGGRRSELLPIHRSDSDGDSRVLRAMHSLAGKLQQVFDHSTTQRITQYESDVCARERSRASETSPQVRRESVKRAIALSRSSILLQLNHSLRLASTGRSSSGFLCGSAQNRSHPRCSLSTAWRLFGTGHNGNHQPPVPIDRRDASMLVLRQRGHIR